MSGPIVRKYGFPNFEKIFGNRELQHGTGDEKGPANEPAPAGEPTNGETNPSPSEKDQSKKG